MMRVAEPEAPESWRDVARQTFEAWRKTHSRGTEQETWEEAFRQGARWAWWTGSALARRLNQTEKEQ